MKRFEGLRGRIHPSASAQGRALEERETWGTPRSGKVKINTKVKTGGQECPPYTLNIPAALRFPIGRATRLRG